MARIQSLLDKSWGNFSAEADRGALLDLTRRALALNMERRAAPCGALEPGDLAFMERQFARCCSRSLNAARQPAVLSGCLFSDTRVNSFTHHFYAPAQMLRPAPRTRIRSAMLAPISLFLAAQSPALPGSLVSGNWICPIPIDLPSLGTSRSGITFRLAGRPLSLHISEKARVIQS
jgi:hypothetical protein